MIMIDIFKGGFVAISTTEEAFRPMMIKKPVPRQSFGE